MSELLVAIFMKRHRVTRRTFYGWRQKYGGLAEDEASGSSGRMAG